MTTMFRRMESRPVLTLHRGTYPACTSDTSACRGGRLPCPTPDSCVLSEDEVSLTPTQTLAWWAPVVIPFAGVIGLALGAAYAEEIGAFLSRLLS